MHEKGRVNGLVGKQVGKQTELEGNASNRPKTQVESMLWEKCAGFFKKERKKREVYPSLAEHVGLRSNGVNVSGPPHFGLNLDLPKPTQLGVVKDKFVMPHQALTIKPEPLKFSPELQGR